MSWLVYSTSVYTLLWHAVHIYKVNARALKVFAVIFAKCQKGSFLCCLFSSWIFDEADTLAKVITETSQREFKGEHHSYTTTNISEWHLNSLLMFWGDYLCLAPRLSPAVIMTARNFLQLPFSFKPCGLLLPFRNYSRFIYFTVLWLFLEVLNHYLQILLDTSARTEKSQDFFHPVSYN